MKKVAIIFALITAGFMELQLYAEENWRWRRDPHPNAVIGERWIGTNDLGEVREFERETYPNEVGDYEYRERRYGGYDRGVPGSDFYRDIYGGY